MSPDPEESSMTLARVFTSELVLRAEIPAGGRDPPFQPEQYEKEYRRRMTLLGCSPENIRELYASELAILKEDPALLARGEPWIERFFFAPLAFEQPPDPEKLTLSELVLITDEANAVMGAQSLLRYGGINEQARELAYRISLKGEALSARALRDRVRERGWTQTEQDLFVGNENNILKIYRWGYNSLPIWTAQSTDPETWKRAEELAIIISCLDL